MRFTLFILLILFTFTTKAESLCNYPIIIGKNIFSLNQTTLEEIDKKYGFTERFDFGEYGTQAVCYQNSKNFLLFGFHNRNKNMILSRVEVSLLPPTGHEKSFCLSIDEKLAINNKLLGSLSSNLKDKNSKIEFKQNDTNLKGKNGPFFILEDYLYFYNRLAFYAIGISEND